MQKIIQRTNTAKKGTRELISREHLTYPSIDYYPLQIGNMWEYRTLCQVSTPQGALLKNMAEERELVSQIRHKDSTTFEIQLYHETIEADESKTEFTTNYDLTWNSLKDSDSPAIFLLRPLKEGTTWQWQDEQSVHEVRVAELTSLDVPAGYFPNVLKIIDYARDNKGQILSIKTDWFALNVGRVQSHIIYTEPNTQAYLEEMRELISFSINR